MTSTSENHLPHYRVRPRFQIETPFSVETISEKIKSGLKQKDAPCIGKVNTGYAVLFIPVEDQHYWSPQLTLTLEESESGSQLRGLYGPRTAVWTMFVFFYSIIAFAVLFICIIGFSSYSLGNPSGILWFVPLLIIVFLSLYLVAYFGQKMGETQMVTLHKFLENCIEIEIDARHHN